MTATTDGWPDLAAENMAQEIGHAVDYLAANGLFGLAWLDEDLVTLRRLGALVDWIPLDQDICDMCLPFQGLRRDLLALQDEEGGSLTLPNVGLKFADQEGPKVSIEVFWDGPAATHLVVVHRLGAPSDLERQLVQVMRGRRIAEENYRRARDRIAEQRQLSDLFLDHAPAAIAMFDRDMRYLAATRRWTQAFSLEQVPLIGQSHYEVFPHYAADPSRIASDRQRHRSALDGHTVEGGVEPVALPGGGVEWVQWDHQPWRRSDGTIGGLIMFGEVVTQQHESHERLEDKNRELESVNRELEEFASVISHELKAPLRALRAAAGPLEAGASDAAAGALRTISHQLDRMETMLADLLDYGQIGHRSEIVRKVDLGKLVRDVAASHASRPEIQVRLAGQWPETETAVAPLDLVLRNLIDNAVKHHDRDTGQVIVSIKDEGAHWTIDVGDDGPGIDPTFHERIFEPFRRLEAADPVPGSGIGLALVKKTVELHGGDIELLSNPALGRGATFRVHWKKT